MSDQDCHVHVDGFVVVEGGWWTWWMCCGWEHAEEVAIRVNLLGWQGKDTKGRVERAVIHRNSYRRSASCDIFLSSYVDFYIGKKTNRPESDPAGGGGKPEGPQCIVAHPRRP